MLPGILPWHKLWPFPFCCTFYNICGWNIVVKKLISWFIWTTRNPITCTLTGWILLMWYCCYSAIIAINCSFALQSEEVLVITQTNGLCPVSRRRETGCRNRSTRLALTVGVEVRLFYGNYYTLCRKCSAVAFYENLNSFLISMLQAVEAHRVLRG
jgi:hypothetical protein